MTVDQLNKIYIKGIFRLYKLKLSQCLLDDKMVMIFYGSVQVPSDDKIFISTSQQCQHYEDIRQQRLSCQVDFKKVDVQMAKLDYLDKPTSQEV